MIILSNKFPADLIKKANELIDSISYTNSLFIFESDTSEIHKLLRDQLSTDSLFKEILDNSYIVVRCVKNEDKKISFYPHYDNYIDTYLIPLKVPKVEPCGDLYYKTNARKMPSNILICTFTKFLIQNSIIRYIIKNYFLRSFKKLHVNIGDIAHFNGITTLHFNDIVSSERRSILIHRNNPFRSSWLNSLIEWGGRLNIKLGAKTMGK